MWQKAVTDFASYSIPVGLQGSSLTQTAGEKLDGYWSPQYFHQPLTS